MSSINSTVNIERNGGLLRAPKSVVRDLGLGSRKQPFAALGIKVLTGRGADVGLHCEQSKRHHLFRLRWGHLYWTNDANIAFTKS